MYVRNNRWRVCMLTRRCGHLPRVRSFWPCARVRNLYAVSEIEPLSHNSTIRVTGGAADVSVHARIQRVPTHQGAQRRTGLPKWKARHITPWREGCPAFP